MKDSHLKVLFLFLLFTAAVPLFAQEFTALDTVADKVLKIFTGKVVQIILVCCLIGCGVGYGFSKDNEKMKRSIIAIAVAIIIVGGASVIAKFLWESTGSTNGWISTQIEGINLWLT